MIAFTNPMLEAYPILKDRIDRHDPERGCGTVLQAGTYLNAGFCAMRDQQSFWHNSYIFLAPIGDYAGSR